MEMGINASQTEIHFKFDLIPPKIVNFNSSALIKTILKRFLAFEEFYRIFSNWFTMK